MAHPLVSSFHLEGNFSRAGFGNLPYAVVRDRLYAVAQLPIQLQENATGQSLYGPWVRAMRQVLSPDKLGPIFWLSENIPAGFATPESGGLPTYQQMDAQTRGDAQLYLGGLVNTMVPSLVASQPLTQPTGEHSLYRVPGTSELVLLIRGGKHGLPPGNGRVFASSCELPSSGHEHHPKEDMGVCMFGCCSQTVQLESVFAEQQPPAHPDARHCNWSSPVKTGILDATSRTCAGPMPRGQGVWMLGNANDRNHLVLSVAPDGRNFSRHWIVRSGTPSPIAFPDPHKIPGVAQYPSGMWRGDEMVAVYSEGKENISISSFRMPSLHGQ